MYVKFRDNLGVSVVEISFDCVTFDDGYAWFTGIDEITEYRIPIEHIIEIFKM